MTDQKIRQHALAIENSFIVQAPAGSGKTELLIQRYLCLLAQVQSPEEIVAITFTRKAAGEMRERILSALSNTSPKQTITNALAKQALQQNQKKAWHLLDNPNRLQIFTIDAMAARLCAQIPLLTGFGAQAKITEEPNCYYEKAAQTLLLKADYREHVEKLLLHLDNNVDYLKSLLLEMLSHREQWLPHITPYHRDSSQLKQTLEMGLKNIVSEQLRMVFESFNSEWLKKLIPLAQFAGQNVKKIEANHSILPCSELNHLPKPTLNYLDQWIGLANLLLTQSGQWRKTVNKSCGFPAVTDSKNQAEIASFKEKKSEFIALLKKFSTQESLRVHLHDLMHCPAIKYSDQQWIVIETLLKLLIFLVAELNLIFQEEGFIDFTELTFGAMRALGSAQEPTDLALHLDYQIRHLLIDEFQDTSLTQFRLIERLTAGWQENNGRTLFLVGDPMQSIYRFRDAEVSLFHQVQHQGIGEIRLIPLTLASNFRSSPTIVNWVNQTFESIFPVTPDRNTGAVTYSASKPVLNNDFTSRVSLRSLLEGTAEDEARDIINIIRECQEKNPRESIAILVRSRNQLIDIIPKLKSAGIAYRAIDIEALNHRIEIRDLVSLTRGLHYLNDRIAWLSILRAPWCGLTLNDLHAITHHNPKKFLYENIQHYATISQLSDDGKNRLARIVPIILASRESRRRLPLSSWIKGVWLALGGPACLENEIEMANTQVYFKLLEQFDASFEIPQLLDKLEQLYAQTNETDDNPIQIMTIHKAKGLEFDHVILPSLHRKIASDKNRLLLWLEKLEQNGQSDLILAPMKSTYDDSDSIYDYLKRLEKTKADNESIRLFYVAVTRTKKSIHLLMQTTFDPNDETKLLPPSKDTFMDLIGVTNKISLSTAIIPNLQKTTGESDLKISQPLKRLAASWQSPLIDSTETIEKQSNFSEIS